MQAKLLRFVQEKQVTRVGGTRPRAVDVRLVAVTNRDLAAEVTAGRFREDLYYRLKVVHLEVPPLAERPDDVPVLVDHFVSRFAARYQKGVRGLSPRAAELAERYPWPGNVRELEHRILQAVLLSEGSELGPEDLELDRAGVPAAGVPATGSGRRAEGSRSEGRAAPAVIPESEQAGTETMEFDLEQVEKRHIERILEAEEGSMARAARRLGIRRNTLYHKIRKYGIERPGR